MISLIIFALLFLLLIGIFVCSGRGHHRPRGLNVRPCPHCREPMHAKATVCPHCGRESKIHHWPGMHDRLWAKE
jgi:predicted amidophosphoribosyltransferase